MNAKKFFSQFSRGAAMGLGMAIPGVSAGTIAVIVGIYDELIDSFASLRKNFKKSFMTILPIALGLVIASVLLLIGIHYCYDKAEYVISCIFAGLVIGTSPIIAREAKLKETSAKKIIFIIVGFIIAAGIGIGSCMVKLYGHLDFNAEFIKGVWWTYPVCLLAGFVAMTACVIPGISGSMCLFMVGLYNPLISIVVGENSIFRNTNRTWSGIGLILCTGVGILAGVIFASKVMKKALAKTRDGTFSMVYGFVLGSIVCLFANQSLINEEGVWAYQRTPTWGWIVGSVLLVLITIASYFLIAKKQKQAADKKEQEQNQSVSAD